jgi:pyrimidine operon attenuation protein/uracil phosphoribosyltransferase
MQQIREKAQLMSASEIDRTLVRLAHEVLERSGDLDKLAFVAIQRRGVPLATRLAKKIQDLEQRSIPVGSVGIQHYRDDLTQVAQQPVAKVAEIPFDVTGKNVILVDDVLHTGRTVRAAIDAIFAHGRPARIELLVLIDRGPRELPIEARYVGRVVATKPTENIDVQFQEIDGSERVLLTEKTE